MPAQTMPDDENKEPTSDELDEKLVASDVAVADWRESARRRLVNARRHVRDKAASVAGLSREALLLRLGELINHSQLNGPVTAAFRKRNSEAMSDDELRALVADVEALIAIAGDQAIAS